MKCLFVLTNLYAFGNAWVPTQRQCFVAPFLQQPRLTSPSNRGAMKMSHTPIETNPISDHSNMESETSDTPSKSAPPISFEAALGQRLQSAWRAGLEGSEQTVLDILDLDDGSVEWRGATGETSKGAAAVAARLAEMGQFYGDPCFTITAIAPEKGSASGSGLWRVEWQFSGTWPFPWRPRIRLSGRSSVVTSRGATSSSSSVDLLRVRRIDDEWLAPSSLPDLVLSQLNPRLFDALNIFNTPHAEFVEGKVEERCQGYQIRWVPKHLVLKIRTEIDPGNEEMNQGFFLPNFAFTGPIKQRGKFIAEDLVATSPLSVSIEAVDSAVFDGKKIKQATWTIPVPSEHGLDMTNLPPVPPLDEREEGELIGPCAPTAYAAFELVPARRIAVVPFGMGDTVSQEASDVRRKLLNALERDGRRFRLSASSNKPLFTLHENTVKLCWTRGGAHGMAVYSPRPSYLRPHEISAEILP
uniref:Uncharacterized protein n=1 Tax=Octactis speculum TaxID=3111310 RepID=A0A7S2BLZ7_9STRA|mmetsp:Transcript_24560/g.33627  ORF Transcript_24560/g.33627 Transcript_24560/m.33627 type:complete len:470 (+) Transcript_24560:24-1433(+)